MTCRGRLKLEQRAIIARASQLAHSFAIIPLEFDAPHALASRISRRFDGAMPFANSGATNFQPSGMQSFSDPFSDQHPGASSLSPSLPFTNGADGLSEYEKTRDARVAENNAKLVALGLEPDPRANLGGNPVRSQAARAPSRLPPRTLSLAHVCMHLTAQVQKVKQVPKAKPLPKANVSTRTKRAAPEPLAPEPLAPEPLAPEPPPTMVGKMMEVHGCDDDCDFLCTTCPWDLCEVLAEDQAVKVYDVKICKDGEICHRVHARYIRVPGGAKRPRCK